jgi:phosphoribosylformylglycinamidine (FGAM) synthase-like enzyme
VVTKEFKRPGNRLALVGRADAEALGGSVYADAHGQRGDRLFDPGGAACLRATWDALLRLHREGAYVSGSAIAEGGMCLRLFEASFGSGLGARINLDAFPAGRRDGFLFGEFIGSVLLELPAGVALDAAPGSVPHRIVGEVTQEPKLELAAGGKTVWAEETSTLAEIWERTFREVVK